MNQIEILDTTLRDGAQSEGISYSVKDKTEIISALDSAGIQIIEAGNPGLTPKDAELFRLLRAYPLEHARIAAFSSTCRKDTRPENDVGLEAILASGCKCAVIFGKTHAGHVESILQTTLDENERMVFESIRHLTKHGVEVIFDAEHFFEAMRCNEVYAMRVLRLANKAGASCLCLCDTNGGCFPSGIANTVRHVRQTLKANFAIHCHNDMGMAVAGSLEAVKAGAVQVQGTFLGNGERCGNACLSTIIPNLQLKMMIPVVKPECLARFTDIARLVSDVSNIRLDKDLPYVGHSAFAHKAGIHSDAVLKLPETYEHIDPALVGNTRHLPLSEYAGRQALLRRFARFFPEGDKESPELQSVHMRLKDLESEGFQFEAAEGSLELIIRRETGHMREFFELVDCKLIEQQPAAPGCTVSAIIKIRVDGREELAAAEGEGPVHAIDTALRLALNRFYPTLARAHLTDYKVRVLTPEAATAAKVRVLIRSGDGTDEWSTIGVSKDIIEASFDALRDSINYKLINDYDKGLIK